jgi:hypothetical protein
VAVVVKALCVVVFVLVVFDSGAAAAAAGTVDTGSRAASTVAAAELAAGHNLLRSDLEVPQRPPPQQTGMLTQLQRAHLNLNLVQDRSFMVGR